MNAEVLLSKYEIYLSRLINDDGRLYGKVYVKDKLSRLRRLLKVVSAHSLCEVSEKNFTDVCQLVMSAFPVIISRRSGRPRYEYNDYLVVLRQIYHMNTGVAAPRNIQYGGAVRTKVKAAVVTPLRAARG